MKIGGVIPAAGMSSRMGQFKPLMKLNGYDMAALTVQSMENAGIYDICVVTGNQAERLEPALEGTAAVTVQTPGYRHSDMLQSVKTGLAALSRADFAVILPVDVPLVAPSTFAALEAAANSGRPVIVPAFKGKTAHPVFISRSCFAAVLGYEGANGLRGALAGFDRAVVEVDDECACMDADRPEDFARLERAAAAQTGISAELCLELYEQTRLLPNIRRHCRAVGELAACMARRLISCGYKLDVFLCESGGRLHDIKRLEYRHHIAGAEFLAEKGYAALAEVVRKHMSFYGRPPRDFDEAVIVSLADKLEREDTRVSVFERYAPALAKYPPGGYIGDNIRTDITFCTELVEKYKALTGADLNRGEV